jgi:putative phosphoribosyl transferase
MSANLYEKKEMRNRINVFENRVEAGNVLGRMLEPFYADSKNAYVLAIPSGGVPVGIEVSRILNIPFDVVIVRKINIPGNTEAGFGAVTVDGSITINKSLFSQLHLKTEEFEHLVAQVRKELVERDYFFRKNRQFPDLSGKLVILIDDGLASGYTMIATINMVKKSGERKIIVAAPTAPRTTIQLLLPLVDEIFCPNIREGPYFAVAEAYDNWCDLSREEVVRILREKRNQS